MRLFHVISEERYLNRYRIASARLAGYDYRLPGWYFITICTHRRRCTLGTIQNGITHLSDAGKIVDEEWHKTAHVRSNIVLGEWVVMPNHVHGLIGIMNGRGEVPTGVETSRPGCLYAFKSTTSAIITIGFVGGHHMPVQIDLHKTHPCNV